MASFDDLDSQPIDLFEEYFKIYNSLLEEGVSVKVVTDRNCENSERAINARHAYSETISYVNMTGSPITVCNSGNSQITIPVSKLHGGDRINVFSRYTNYYKELEVFRILKTFKFRDMDAMREIMISIAKKPTKTLTDENLESQLNYRLGELNKVHYNEKAYNDNAIDILTVDIVTSIRLKTIREAGKKQLNELGLVVYEGSIDPSYTYPNSREHAVQEHYYSLIGTQSGLGYSVEIVDNDNLYDTRYLNIAGIIHEIPTVCNQDRKDGFYFILVENGQTVVTHHSIEEAETLYNIGKSRESAKNFGDNNYLQENTRRNSENENLELKKEAAINKVDSDKIKMENELLMLKLKNANESAKLKTEQRTLTIKTVAAAIAAVGVIAATVFKFKSNQ